MKNSNIALPRFKESKKPTIQNEEKEKEASKKVFMNDLKNDMLENGIALEEVDLMIETFNY